MTWRTVILTKESKISLRLNHLVIANDRVVTVPLTEIGQIVIENPNIVMTGHILNALSEHKITTIICNEKHIPFSHINLIHGHFRQPRVVQKQIRWPSNHKKELWKEIIKSKIYNQKSVLKKMFYLPFENFDQYISEVELDDHTNREGHAAKVYFNQLFGLGFIRGRDDPINWGLNYGYSVLLALFTRVITTKGLLTEIGIHHRNQFNQFNLASDFMEVYRPLIDWIVINNITDEFSRESKRELLNIFNKKLLIKNRKQYLTNSIEIYIDGIIKYLEEGDIEQLSFPKLLL